MSTPLKIKANIMDCLISDYPIIQRENLLNEILLDYFSLIDDDE